MATNNALNRQFGGDLFGDLISAEISITGTTTATISRMHVCSGTSSDYTVTLPATSGNAGKIIGFRMASGLTKLVTLDGNASETIDGNLTRVMWAQESAILLCDGTNWTKIAGKAVPMNARMTLVSAQSTADITVTKVNWDTVIYANGLTADTTNHRIVLPRPSIYNGVGVVQYSFLNASANTQSRLRLNGTLVAVGWAFTSANGTYPLMVAVINISASASDYFELDGYQQSGGTGNLLNNDAMHLTVTELPNW